MFFSCFVPFLPISCFHVSFKVRSDDAPSVDPVAVNLFSPLEIPSLSVFRNHHQHRPPLRNAVFPFNDVRLDSSVIDNIYGESVISKEADPFVQCSYTHTICVLHQVTFLVVYHVPFLVILRERTVVIFSQCAFHASAISFLKVPGIGAMALLKFR